TKRATMARAMSISRSVVPDRGSRKRGCWADRGSPSRSASEIASTLRRIGCFGQFGAAAARRAAVRPTAAVRGLLIAIVLESRAANIGGELARARPAMAGPLQINRDLAHIAGVRNRMRDGPDGDGAIVSHARRVGADRIEGGGEA